MIYLEKLIRYLGYIGQYDEQHLMKCIYSHMRPECQIVSPNGHGPYFLIKDSIAVRNYIHNYFYLQHGINRLLEFKVNCSNSLEQGKTNGTI